MPSPPRDNRDGNNTSALASQVSSTIPVATKTTSGNMEAPMRPSEARAGAESSLFSVPLQRRQDEPLSQSSPLPPGPPAAASSPPGRQQSSSGGWLMTSCDAADPTTGPQSSLSEELKRLQLIRSYHAKDTERDACLDRLISMACRVFQTPVALVAFLDMGRLMFRCNPEAPPDHQTPVSRTLRSCSQALQQHSPDVFVINDAAAAKSRSGAAKRPSVNSLGSNHHATEQQPDHTNDSHSHVHSDDPEANPTTTTTQTAKPTTSSPLQYQFLAGAPLISPEGCRLGAFCILDQEPRPDGLSAELQSNLADYAHLALKTIVDRRRITTQNNPSHLVACTAHDLITPLTGIQLSLSLLQQDAEFQQKLGDEQTKSIAAAVRSSNMMLRICQSTIETLRGNRNISIGNHWTIPRNLIQPQSSPFVDLKDFVKNLESISSSIPKRVPLTITIDPEAPVSVVTDGLKIFRSSLNLLSNACSNTRQGYITFRIFDSGKRTLVFECEDTGKNLQGKTSESLFQQDGESSDLGLYSLATQISWLGGKYGYRSRSSSRTASRGDVNAAAASIPNNVASKEEGSIFWFSIPLVLPQDVSDLMGLATQYTESMDTEAKPPPSKEDMPLTPPTTPLADEPPKEGGVTSEPPVAVGAAAAAATASLQPKSDRQIKALIIEDSSVIRKILAKALTKYGYEVVQAVNGMEGLEELKKSMFDMVLCDFLMPVMDGLDCVSQYREWEKRSRPYFHQHIVGISAHANQKDIDRGVEIGMDDFKPKPILPKTLAQLHESPTFQRIRATLDKLDASKQRQLSRRMHSSSSSFDALGGDPMSMVSKNSFHEAMPSPNNIVIDVKAGHAIRPAKRTRLDEEIQHQVRKASDKSQDG